jgi:YD repeat-containing protein
VAADGGPSQGLGPNQLSFEHNYAYTPAGKVAGKVTAKTLTLSSAAYSGSLTAGYTYDNQGTLMQTVYPGCQPSQSCTFTYTLDGMERPTQLEDNLNKIYATGVTYNAANQSSYGRRTYNNLLQLTQADVFEYKYSATRNNGQIVASGDMGTGEVATYQYDALKRLSSATSNKNRGESYGYDGWGDLTQMTPTGSPAGYNGLPSLQVTVDPHTNQIINAPGVSYTPKRKHGVRPKYTEL